MNEQRSCLIMVPSPTEGSDESENLTALLELIVYPALDKYNFRIVREDLEAEEGLNHLDIINMVQSYDLCIFDITTNNPDVFYYCGRRHETNRPFLTLTDQKEEEKGDRKLLESVTYDLASGWTIKDSITKLRSEIDEMDFENADFPPSTELLVNITKTLNRIESKISAISSQSAEFQTNDQITSSISGNPVDQYYTGIDNGDYKLASQALMKYMEINPNYDLLLQMASPILSNFEPIGEKIVTDILDNHLNEIAPVEIGFTLFELYNYYRIALTLENNKPYLFNIVDTTLTRDGLLDIDKARLINVKASIEYTLKDLDKCIEYQKETIELVPNEPVYYYNLARPLEELGKIDEAREPIKEMIQVQKEPGFQKFDLKGLDYAENFVKQHGPDSLLKEIENVRNLALKAQSK